MPPAPAPAPGSLGPSPDPPAPAPPPPQPLLQGTLVGSRLNWCDMICQTLAELPQPRMVVQDLFVRMCQLFPEMRQWAVGKGWEDRVKNRIKSTLSIKNAVFLKVPRPPEAPGKGAWWTLTPHALAEWRTGKKAVVVRTLPGSLCTPPSRLLQTPASTILKPGTSKDALATPAAASGGCASSSFSSSSSSSTSSSSSSSSRREGRHRRRIPAAFKAPTQPSASQSGLSAAPLLHSNPSESSRLASPFTHTAASASSSTSAAAAAALAAAAVGAALPEGQLASTIPNINPAFDVSSYVDGPEVLPPLPTENAIPSSFKSFAPSSSMPDGPLPPFSLPFFCTNGIRVPPGAAIGTMISPFTNLPVDFSMYEDTICGAKNSDSSSPVQSKPSPMRAGTDVILGWTGLGPDAPKTPPRFPNEDTEKDGKSFSGFFSSPSSSSLHSERTPSLDLDTTPLLERDNAYSPTESDEIEGNTERSVHPTAAMLATDSSGSFGGPGKLADCRSPLLPSIEGIMGMTGTGEIGTVGGIEDISGMDSDYLLFQESHGDCGLYDQL